MGTVKLSLRQRQKSPFGEPAGKQLPVDLRGYGVPNQPKEIAHLAVDTQELLRLSY